MRYLFYFYSCFNPTFMGMLLDEAIEKTKDPGNEVLFVYCGGIFNMCLFNQKGSRPLCGFCSSVVRKTLSNYNVKNEPLTKYRVKKEAKRFEYKTSEELRALQYKDVSIGLGFMSGYISSTRNLNPVINEESKKYFDAHLQQDVEMIDAFYNLLDQYKPDVVYTFNGRYEEVRSIYDICMKLNIHLFLSEGFPRNGIWKKVMFEDHLPHDIKYWVSRRDYSWDHYRMSEDEKNKLGHSFYLNRRNGVYAGDKIYIKDQIAGSIPDIDSSKINIAIMNSSEDEYAAVGADWDRLKFFPTQYDGIIYLIEHAAPNVHYYLRIHPNLKDIKYKFHTNLLDLPKKYDCITVIPADSPISTYSLLDAVDKVVVFGSTMGIESVYWKMPVINLGPALYSYDNICYEPKDLADLDQLILSDLEPLYSDAVIKYGAFSMNQDPVIIEDKNICFQLKNHKFLKMQYSSTPYISFFINEEVTAFLVAICRFFLGSSLFARYTIPLEEDTNY